MSQQQGRVTNSLANIIRAVQAERRTGEIQVFRGNNTNSETGSIAFIHGQIVAARLGSYQGPQAFNLLSAWGQCIFIFISSTPPPVQTQYSPASGPISGPVSGPLRTQHSPVSGQLSGPIRTPALQQRSDTMPRLERVTSSHSGSLLSLTTIPCATMSVLKAVKVIEMAGLPRSYRQLILLIDGQRSLEGLIVTLGIEPGDVTQMLQTLEQLKVIRLIR